MSRSIKAVASNQATEPYQPDYEPSTLTSEQRERINQRGDLLAANSELDRVARNIARAVANPHTPEIVRLHLQAYLTHHFCFDLTKKPEAITALYPVACRRIGETPFIPDRELVEALTGNDRDRAIAEAEADPYFPPHRQMSVERVAEKVELVMAEINDEAIDEVVGELIRLIRAIGLESDPEHRKRLVKAACRAAYGQSDEHRQREQEFIEQAMSQRLAS